MTLRTAHSAPPIAAAVVVGVLSVSLNAFRDYQIAEIAVYVVAVAGLTVLIGLSGQISLGNGAFMAVGAYADGAAAAAPATGRCAALLAGQRRGRGGGRGASSAWPPPGCAARTWRARPSCSASRCPSLATPVPGRASAATRA